VSPEAAPAGFAAHQLPVAVGERVLRRAAAAQPAVAEERAQPEAVQQGVVGERVLRVLAHLPKEYRGAIARPP
jgi:hypothetical protein